MATSISNQENAPGMPAGQYDGGNSLIWLVLSTCAKLKIKMSYQIYNTKYTQNRNTNR